MIPSRIRSRSRALSDARDASSRSVRTSSRPTWCAASRSDSSLAISLEHAQVAGALVGDHRDPFDRMLIALAREEKMALVSNDAVFDAFDVRRIW